MLISANPGAATPTVIRGADVNFVSGRREMAMGFFGGRKSYLTEYLLPRIIRRCEASWEDKPYHKHLTILSGNDNSGKSSEFVKNQSLLKFSPSKGVKRASLSQDIRDYLLGKSPLRLIVAAVVTHWDKRVRFETLECGHQLYSYERYTWDNGHLEYLGWPEKRRRCNECKKALLVAPKKPSQSVGLKNKEEAA